jgi:hypothetical protein
VTSLSCDGGGCAIDSSVLLFDPIEMVMPDRIGKAPIWHGDPAPHEGPDMYTGCQEGPLSMAPHCVMRVVTPTTGSNRDLTDGLGIGGGKGGCGAGSLDNSAGSLDKIELGDSTGGLYACVLNGGLKRVDACNTRCYCSSYSTSTVA